MSYTRRVQYYETDQMGVVHHSNYIRWFEESRVDLMDKLGFSYKKTEDIGLMIPVLGIKCSYISPAKFEDIVEIIPEVIKLTQVKMTLSYQVRNFATKKIIATGESNHCFVNSDFKPVSLPKHCCELYNIFSKFCK